MRGRQGLLAEEEKDVRAARGGRGGRERKRPAQKVLRETAAAPVDDRPTWGGGGGRGVRGLSPHAPWRCVPVLSAPHVRIQAWQVGGRKPAMLGGFTPRKLANCKSGLLPAGKLSRSACVPARTAGCSASPKPLLGQPPERKTPFLPRARFLGTRLRTPGELRWARLQTQPAPAAGTSGLTFHT